jgi:hypothetical protein
LQLALGGKAQYDQESTPCQRCWKDAVPRNFYGQRRFAARTAEGAVCMSNPIRSIDVLPVNFSIEREALEILRECSPTAKGHGRFVSRLLYEYRAKREERDRLRRKMAEALLPDDEHAAPPA